MSNNYGKTLGIFPNHQQTCARTTKLYRNQKKIQGELYMH